MNQIIQRASKIRQIKLPAEGVLKRGNTIDTNL